MSNNYFTEQQELEQYVARLEVKVKRLIVDKQAYIELEAEAEKLAEALGNLLMDHNEVSGPEGSAVLDAYRKFKGEGEK